MTGVVEKENRFTHPLSSDPSRTNPSGWGASSRGPARDLSCVTALGCPEGNSVMVIYHQYKIKLTDCLFGMIKLQI